MKRPKYWLRGALLVGLALAVGAWVSLRWLVPRSVVRAIELASGGTLVTDRVELSFPLTTTLTGLRLAGNTSEAGLSIPQVVVRPHWFSIPSRTLRLDTLEIRRPLVRLTRMKDGTIRWPENPLAHLDQAEASVDNTPHPSGASRPAAWQIHIDSFTIIGGVLEFVDEKSASPFHGLVDHLSLVAGPLTVASDGASVFIAPSPGASGTEQAGISVAVRGEVVGDAGSSAPAYCSGWIEPSAKDLQVSCRMEPLPLTAFDPYYHGPTELRVYTSTLKSTSQWEAKANQLTARVQVEINDLSEGDLSVRGRTIVDVKRLPGGSEPRLAGEISLSGPLDHPGEWEGAFQPGDERVQDLVKRLLEHGVTRIRIALGNRRMHISVAPSTEATMTDIEAASREIQEALEILAGPIPIEPPAAASEAAASAPAEAAIPVPAAEPTTPAPTPSETTAAPTPAPPTPEEQAPAPAPGPAQPLPPPSAATESSTLQPTPPSAEPAPASPPSAPPSAPTQPGS